MRGVVRCDHCGAPHRRDAASTRFRCDWCGGDNRVEAIRLVEELLLAADDHSRDPATRVREAFGCRGLREVVLSPSPHRWVGIWQVVNDEGEEFLSPVQHGEVGERVLRVLPAAPLRTLDDEPPGWARDMPPRPSPEHDADSIVEAARANFDSPDSDVVLVRLVWMGVAEFTVGYGDEISGAVQILGTDGVIFENLPETRTTALAIPERLYAWGLFVIGALLLGIMVPEPGPRLAFEVAWFAFASLYWLIRRDRGAGALR
jgi:hypothetical protein